MSGGQHYAGRACGWAFETMRQFQKHLRRWAKHLPYIRTLAQERDKLRTEVGHLSVEVMQLGSAVENLRSECDSAKVEADRVIEHLAAERDAALLKSLLKPGDMNRIVIVPEAVHELDEQFFRHPRTELGIRHYRVLEWPANTTGSRDPSGIVTHHEIIRI
jgi:hypothetical protein